MHVLDLIMYFVCVAAIWGIMEFGWKGEITQEIGGLIGMFVIIIFTIIYIIFFVLAGYNWCDFSVNWAAVAGWFKW